MWKKHPSSARTLSDRRLLMELIELTLAKALESQMKQQSKLRSVAKTLWEKAYNKFDKMIDGAELDKAVEKKLQALYGHDRYHVFTHKHYSTNRSEFEYRPLTAVKQELRSWLSPKFLPTAQNQPIPMRPT